MGFPSLMQMVSQGKEVCFRKKHAERGVRNWGRFPVLRGERTAQCECIRVDASPYDRMRVIFFKMDMPSPGKSDQVRPKIQMDQSGSKRSGRAGIALARNDRLFPLICGYFRFFPLNEKKMSHDVRRNAESDGRDLNQFKPI
jgi:hypothetical protein